MANYLRPGVFIEESLTPLTQAFSTPGEATAAFVGKATRGPLTPLLVTSWQQYVANFGPFDSNYLSYAVYSYFNNGGRGAYIVRAASSDAVAATVAVNDRQGSPATLLRITADNPGAWGNAVYFDIVDNGTVGRFNFTLRVGGTADANIVERYIDMSMNPVDPRYLPNIINAPTPTGSNYVLATDLQTGVWSTAKTPVAGTATPLTTGAEGSATINYVTATQTLAVLDEVLNVNVPGLNDVTALNLLITWVESVGNIFLVIDAPQASATESGTVTAYTSYLPGGGGSSLTATSYAAVYGPWLLTDDPNSVIPGSARTLPPGGAVLGRYASGDVLRGVQKAPAGSDIPLKGILGTELRFVPANQDTLAGLGLNLIKVVPGSGFVVYGARTLKQGTPDRYINVRRALQYIRKNLTDLTAFAVFEENAAPLWARLEAISAQFLMTQMQVGLLKGNAPNESFFVKCDAENNPPAQVASGTVVLQVGVAIASPAEFVVIRIGLYDGSTTVDETV